MKSVRKRLLMGTVIMVLVMLSAACNHMDDRYKNLGDEAPMPDVLHPAVEENKNTLLERADQIDIDAVITDGLRSVEAQDELYAEGRSTDGNVVTHAKGGESYHNYGLAIDYALKDESGDIIWNTEYDGNDNGQADWLEVAEIAKDLGFEWGGDWESFPDYPHLQMNFDLSIDELQNGWRPTEDAGGETTE